MTLPKRMISPDSSTRIWLIGMPGAGKSTYGKRLARSLGHAFVDLDHEIVLGQGMEIANIFHVHGEPEFRRLEREMVQRYCAGSPGVVIATGGGTPCFFNNMERMNSCGVTVFLDTPLDILVNRLRQKTGRPMFDEKEDTRIRIEALWKERRAYYKQANICVQAGDIADIKKQIEQYVQSAK